MSARIVRPFTPEACASYLIDAPSVPSNQAEIDFDAELVRLARMA